MSARSGPGFDFYLASAYGIAEEKRTHEILAQIQSGGIHVEVKSDFYLNARLFVEAQHAPNRGPWRDSGIRTTTSELVVFNKARFHALHIYNSAELRAAAAAGFLGRLVPGAGGSCPTMGYFVTAAHIDGVLAHLSK